MAKKTNLERFLERADLLTALAIVDRISTREVLLTFRGRSSKGGSSQQQGWLRQFLPLVEDLITHDEAWTDTDPPNEAHVLLHLRCHD